MKENPQDDMEQRKATRDYLAEILINLGCQPMNQRDDFLVVRYQGENILAYCGIGTVRLLDPGWYSIDPESPDMGLLQKTINIVNSYFGAAVFMTLDEETGREMINTRIDITLHPTSPNNEGYIRDMLEYFFHTKHVLNHHFGILKDAASQKEGEPKSKKKSIFHKLFLKG